MFLKCCGYASVKRFSTERLWLVHIRQMTRRALWNQHPQTGWLTHEEMTTSLASYTETAAYVGIDTSSICECCISFRQMRFVPLFCLWRRGPAYFQRKCETAQKGLKSGWFAEKFLLLVHRGKTSTLGKNNFKQRVHRGFSHVLEHTSSQEHFSGNQW